MIFTVKLYNIFPQYITYQRDAGERSLAALRGREMLLREVGRQRHAHPQGHPLQRITRQYIEYIMIRIFKILYYLIRGTGCKNNNYIDNNSKLGIH